MTLQNIKIALAAVWLASAFIVLMGSAHVTSTESRLALAVFGVLPPLVIWFWWNDPTQTLSQSIQQVRDENKVAPPRVAD